MALAVVIGRIGTDAPYVWIDSHGHVHVVPGWNPEAYAEFTTAVNILSEASKLKTPESTRLIQSALEIVEKSMPSLNMKEGEGASTVVVVV